MTWRNVLTANVPMSDDTTVWTHRMRTESHLYPILTPPRSPLETWQFSARSFSDPLPISGGWGYTLDDAVRIHDGDVTMIEKSFIGRRNQQDLLVSRRRPVDQSLVRIRWEFINQSITQIDGKWMDRIAGIVSGVPNKIVFDQMDTLNDLGDFDVGRRKDHVTDEWEASRIYVEREFWFDITDAV